MTREHVSVPMHLSLTAWLTLLAHTLEHLVFMVSDGFSSTKDYDLTLLGISEIPLQRRP
jgi:hypothetical protein